MLAELGLQLGQRKAFTTLIDEAILQGQVPLMVLILGLLLAAAVIASLCGSLHEYMLSGLCAVIPAEARTQLFHRVQGMPLADLRAAAHGDLVSRIVNDAGGLESALWSLGFVATSLCGVVLALGMLLSTDWRLALLGLGLLLPTIPLGPRLLTPLAERASYAAKEAHGRLSTQLWENLSNQVVIRVFGMRSFVQSRFAQVNQDIRHFTRQYNLYSYFSNRAPWIAVECIEVVVLATGCWMLVRGDITTGALVSFYLLFSALATHAYSLASSFSRLVDVSASMRRIQALQAPQAGEGSDRFPQPKREEPSLAREPTQVRDPSGAPHIRFEAVSFSYPPRSPGGGMGHSQRLGEQDRPGESVGSGETDHLHAVTLEIVSGQLNAFVGASGSGKSTAVHLLLGLQRPRLGRVLIDGQDLGTLALEPFWARTGAVFQDSLLFHATIAENIRAGLPDASDEQMEAAVRSAGLADWIETLPQGYASLVSADTCSGGQRQRIAIARALVRDPALLVLDEPSSALDASTGRAVMETLLKLIGHRTTVLVTHQLRDASRADRIVVFDRGQVVEVGRHEELLAAGGVYRALWDEQEQRFQGCGQG